jgi:hypothetical protein
MHPVDAGPLSTTYFDGPFRRNPKSGASYPSQAKDWAISDVERGEADSALGDENLLPFDEICGSAA